MIHLLNEEPIQYRTMILLLLYTGMRRGELCGLEWKDIDFTERRLSIVRTSQYIGHGQIITKEPKTRSGRRELSLSPTLCTLLKDYRVWQNTRRLRTGERWVNTDRLFTQSNGEPIYPDTVTEWFAKFLTNVIPDLPKVTLHSLRHTNATLMIAEGVHICKVTQTVRSCNISTHHIGCVCPCPEGQRTATRLISWTLYWLYGNMLRRIEYDRNYGRSNGQKDISG